MLHLNSFSTIITMETLWLVIYTLKELSQWFDAELIRLNLIEIYIKQKQSPKSEWLQKDD